MAKGHLSEDTIKFIMTAESSELQQEVHKATKTLDDFKKKEADLHKQQAAIKSVLGEQSKEYKDLSKAIKDNAQSIANENMKLSELYKRLGTNSMTMAQLRKEAKNLQRQLDNTSESLNPKEYVEYAKKLQEVNQRMSELRRNAQGLSSEKGSFLKNILGSETNFKGIKTFLAGSGLFKIGEMIFENVAEWVGRAFDRVKELISGSVQAAREAEGITHAFEQMNQPGILAELRKATHGTVSDLELMKAAVQAKDFRLPLEQLGKYLEFAQLKAQQTGQSVDYLTSSIITGLGRKSKPILDNLGISAAQIDEEMKKGGDMAVAVGRIIEEQMKDAGDHFETASEREQRATTEVSNAQLELGNQMRKTFGIGETSFAEMQAKAETFILKQLTRLIIYLQGLYDKLLIVRLGVEAIKVVFDSVFKICEIGFKWLLDTVRLLGREIRDMASLIEGAFSFDWDKVKSAWNDMGKSLLKSMDDFARHGNDVGYRWGHNLVESINAVLGKSKIDQPGTNELPEVVVNGKKNDPKKPKGTNKDDQQKREADRLAIEQLKQQRQKELSIEQQNYDRLQRLWKEQLSKRAITQQEYDHIMQETALEHAECVLDIERKYGNDSEKLTLNDNSQKLRLLNEQQKNINQAEKNAADARLRAFEVYQKNLQALEASAMSPQEKEKFDRDTQLKVLEAYYQASLEYAKEHNQDQLEIEEAYQKARQKLIINWEQSDADRHFRARSSAGIATADEELQHAKDSIYQDTELSPEEKKDAEAQLEREHQERLFRIRQEYGLVKQQELYDQELEQLRQAKEQGYLTEEEYEKAKTQMKMDQYKQQFDYYKGLFSNAVNALQDAELANVEAKYDAEIDAAKKAGKDTSKLEEKAAEEKLKIQKKYADVQFAIRASEIIADTAQAIIATHKSLGGWTPWAIAAAALMGVTGAAQLAVAAAERNKVKSMTLKGSSGSSSTTGARIATGKEEGGFLDVEREQDGKRFHAKYDPNRRGYVDRPTVIVGEGPAGQSKEWIASNAAVENPTIRPILDILDRHQRAGSVRTLDLNKYLLQQRGYAQGGSIANTPLPSSAGTGISPELMERFVGVMERMERDGIPAILGLDEIDAKNKLRDKSRDIGSK